MALKLKWQGSCKRHRLYNPARDGEGGIKGACHECLRLLTLYQKFCALIDKHAGGD